VRRAVDAATRPSLVFDLGVIEANARAIREAAAGYTVLFAAKSFPHAAVRDVCARWFDGFDVASTGELAQVRGRVLSVFDPTGAALREARAERVIASCETVEQVEAAPASAEIAIRVSLSVAGRDPAIGAIHDGERRRSRFGVETAAEVAALHRAAAGRPVGLHVHHGPVAATSSERFLASARAALALADFEPAFVSLGGAWHAVADLPRALRELRAALAGELVIEPGRALANGAGFACGTVVVARDRLRVTDLSRVCHLRWSQVELVAEHPGRGEPLVFVGPTCFEEDVLGEWVADPAERRLVLRNVSGYAVAWNTGFAGVPPAEVVVVS
jgi:diaminopimelate decarboxylase